jgi:hypothetical protein
VIKVALFDVGETLVHNGQPIPGAIHALQLVSQLKTSADDPLILAIVSDYLMPSQPVTEHKIVALEKQYLTTVLEPTGLAPFFSPFDSRVTISSRVGVLKPDRKIFETALARLPSPATFGACLFITENKSHLAKVRDYGIVPVGFGASVPGIETFSNWNDAPALLATLVAPDDMSNLAISAVPELANQKLVDFQPTSIVKGTLHGRANQLVQLVDPRLGSLKGIYVKRPTEIAVDFSPHGTMNTVHVAQPDKEEIADMANYVHSLNQSGQIDTGSGSKGATHFIKTDSKGRRVLDRSHYSSH